MILRQTKQEFFDIVVQHKTDGEVGVFTAYTNRSSMGCDDDLGLPSVSQVTSNRDAEERATETKDRVS